MLLSVLLSLVSASNLGFVRAKPQAESTTFSTVSSLSTSTSTSGSATRPATISSSASASATSASISNTVSASSTSFTFSSTSASLSISATGTSSSVANITSSSASASASGTESFSVFPQPSQAPISGVFPATDPSDPPPVNARGKTIPDFAPAWAQAISKAKDAIAQLTLEQKVALTTGTSGQRCIGNVLPPDNTTSMINNFDGLCFEDGPLGARLADFDTVFPTGVNTAATFNRDLIRRRGLFMGREFSGKGINIALGPMMNMGRVAQAGRNWEGFGADPFLAGEAAYETILGMQQGGVQSCAKHYIDNEQEFKRTTSSSDVDDRTQHEIYLPAFLKSVMAGVATIMCSYNQVNNTYACENEKMLNDVLKRELGFQGLVMTDWGANHGILAANAGLDLTMPQASNKNLDLIPLVQNGTVPMARLDDMITRLFAGWYLLKQDSPSFPALNFDSRNLNNPTTNQHIDVQDDHQTVVRDIGAASIVLLKNENETLPLKKPRSIALIGSDAGPGQKGDRLGSDGILAVGGGSGAGDFTYLITPLEAIQRRARVDRTTVSWFLNDTNLAQAGSAAVAKSAALVFVNADSSEGSDRPTLTADRGGDALVAAVAAQNPNTIVIVHSVGPLLIESWIDHPNITAVLWAGISGTETGNAVADVLYGETNPSGRLPYTIAKDVNDYIAPTQGTAAILTVPYTEGLLVDYRGFDAKNITPRFEFGFGMSYTDFSYSGLRTATIASADNAQSDLEDAWAAGDASPIAQGSSVALWLHRPFLSVSFNIRNTGSVSGTEIPQIYVHFPSSAGEPPSVLKGFTNVNIQTGQQKSVTITLSRYDLSIWDIVAQGWRKPNGSISITVGASSRDGRLNAELDL